MGCNVSNSNNQSGGGSSNIITLGESYENSIERKNTKTLVTSGTPQLVWFSCNI